jgi:outer membrane protein OmpA-like peptidoglycan-associated protein
MTGARAQRFAALALLAAATALVGCAGAELDQRARQLRLTLRQARSAGAYQCAPRELAVAETHADFAERALEAGDYFGAKGHLAVADSSAQRAIANSAPDRCQGEDSDHDGIPDRVDRCPKDPEDKDGFEDADGCPDPDNDKDGLSDTRDKCPNEPEDVDGFRDDDGCPDPDNDQDGVADAQDKCPLEPEDKDGFQDDDGCPDPDNDKDGYLDGVDKCPNEPGPAGGDGCPGKFKFITVTPDRIELRQTIFFRTSRAEIMSKSYPLLDEVALALKSRPTMRVRIEGHTDSRGNRLLNTRLSQARADSVMTYLAGHGIAPERMEARGFGPDQPIETNKTAAGREKNRRVEFVITQQ